MGKYSDLILATPNLKGYWRLGETSGTVADDAYGLRNGAYVNTPGLGIAGALYGDTDKAVDFRAAQQERIDIPHHADLNLGDNWSVTGWLKIPTQMSGAPRVILSKGDNAYNVRLATDARLELVRSNDAVLMNTAGAVPVGSWVHFAACKNGNDRRLYWNGVDHTSSDVLNSSITEDNSYPLQIGSDRDGASAQREWFDGQLDEIALFGRALTLMEVYQQYRAGIAPPPPRMGLSRLTGGAIVELREGYYGSWFPVTCQILSAKTLWGSAQTEGLLTNAKGGLVECETYDPDRTLDPSNRAGPHYGKLKPGLWIKLSYYDGVTTTVVGQGRVDSIEYRMTDSSGRIRANDWVSWFSNFQFPNDIVGTLTNWTSYNTARGFAKAVIDRINLVTGGAPDYFNVPVTVEPEGIPIYITPEEYPFILAQPGPPLWQQFIDMTEASMFYAYIDRGNVLRFRSLLSSYGYGEINLDITGPQVIDFVSQINAAGILNYIVNKDKSNYVQNRASVDNWGERQFQMVRHFPGANPAPWSPTSEQQWLDLVLADRSEPSLDVMPLQVWPSTPAELKAIINLQALDLVRMVFDVPTPPVVVAGRLMGGAISVSDAGWSAELVCWVKPLENMRLDEARPVDVSDSQ